MPRKTIPVRPATSRVKSRESVFRKVQEDFGEESVSEEDEFQSVSTDDGTTNYRLNYTSQSLKSPRQSRQSSRVTKPPAKAGPSKNTGISPNKSKNVTDRSNTTQVRFSPAQQRSYRTSSPESPRRNLTRGSQSQSERARPRNNPTDSSNRSPSKHRRKQRTPKRKNHILKEIKRLQKDIRLVVPKLPFSRVIRECLMDAGGPEMRISFSALEALQESAELYLVQLFSDAYRCTLHRDRVTLMVKDMQLVRFLRGPLDVGNF